MLDDVIKVELQDMRFHLQRYAYWSECAGNVLPYAQKTYQDEADEHFRRAVHHHANAVGFASRAEQLGR